MAPDDSHGYMVISITGARITWKTTLRSEAGMESSPKAFAAFLLYGLTLARVTFREMDSHW